MFCRPADAREGRSSLRGLVKRQRSHELSFLQMIQGRAICTQAATSANL
jgi:hypothetical protein